MKRLRFLSAVLILLVVAPFADAYVEAPHTFGRVCHESTNIVVVEVTKINKEKNLIICKKIEDLKGKHPKEEIKYNIGNRGFHAREWQNVMKWAEEGKKAVLFYNGQGTETCTGGYWFQCYPEGDWYGMSHAEPFLLRTYCGDVDKLITAVKDVVAGKEVIVPCMMDGDKNLLHERKAKIQRLKASLKLLEYNAKRDFVGLGGDGDEVIEEFKTFTLLAESAANWKFVPAASVKGDGWTKADFDDKAWRTGKAPIGYGEEEIEKRKGTTVTEKGVAFVFRQTFDLKADILTQKGVLFNVRVASDDCATVWLNGVQIDNEDLDHEFSYWNRDVEVPAKHLQTGKNVLAVLVKNKTGSSDIYFDMEVAAAVPLPKPPKKPTPTVGTNTTPNTTGKLALFGPEKPVGLIVDKSNKSVTVPAVIAPRKLPNLQEIYPIEVGATYPAPNGQKAHETIVNFKDCRPSHVQQALLDLGLKAGKPARGEGTKAAGPELKLYLEWDVAGKAQRVPLEQVMVDKKGGKSLAGITWHFTGSAMKQPDPEKDDKILGADLTGTLISFFPVTDDTIIQSSLTMKEEAEIKLEVKDLPKEGTAVRLVIVVK